jgi:hypothetical protein
MLGKGTVLSEKTLPLARTVCTASLVWGVLEYRVPECHNLRDLVAKIQSPYNVADRSAWAVLPPFMAWPSGPFLLSLMLFEDMICLL